MNIRPARTKLLWAIGCLVVGASLTLVGYWVGFRDASFLEAGHFVVSLDALGKLRAGNHAEGIRKVESICFSSAANLVRDPYHREHVRLFLPSLVSYRTRYRTNSAAWTPTERTLEDALAETPQLPRALSDGGGDRPSTNTPAGVPAVP